MTDKVGQSHLILREVRAWSADAVVETGCGLQGWNHRRGDSANELVELQAFTFLKVVKHNTQPNELLVHIYYH